MNIKPVASKADIVQSTSNASTKRTAAINAFNGAQAPTPAPQHAAHAPTLNQNAIAPEDMSALSIPAPNIEESSVENTGVESQESAAPEETAKQPDPALSRQFAQLARQEKALRAKALQQDQQLKAREAALAQREAELAAKQPDLSQYIPRDRLKQDPLGVLNEAEISYEQLTQQEIARQSVDPLVMQTIKDLKSQINELKQANEDGKKAQVTQQQSQYQAAVKQITLDAKALVQSDPVTYEAIHKTGTVKEVVKLIEDTYNKDGIVLSVEEAAQEVENYLVEENFKMATRIDKIKKRIGQVAPSQASAQTSQVSSGQKQPGMKTLTNATSSARPMTARDRAIAAFKGEIK
jgi:hypothetical protein